ncbi:glutaredoxin domain-containing protein [Anaerocolumna sp. AGMB13025]|uniref:glutaredoxin domain-containing protein n=1 Tax=Anaerocolumna sp. AGMB13025 TaxID=3039116 RepID=UPI00241EB3AE|nr:glutaredoxin domain-containing protein [Anaerocolumna sp. AGMB13025]WFR55668.1 glutaredoxin domain-containing protein [Anaerocolumna sp. AGMB13025]
MKITMYGTPICTECVAAKAKLETCKEVELDYREITKSTAILKEFLSYRDHDEIFAPIMEEGKIGIPFFILENNTKTFDIYEFLNEEKPVQTADSCSIDGKGQC